MKNRLGFFMLLFLMGVPIQVWGQTKGKIYRESETIDRIIPQGATIEKLAGGMKFTEGPIWVDEGYLLFSDIPDNVVYKWQAEQGLSVFLSKSGYTGDEPKNWGIGSNGLTLVGDTLILCQHGDRTLAAMPLHDQRAGFTILASKYQGKRLNSPNDVVVKSDGAFYFTDPPYGLQKQDEDPLKELDYNGVYRLKDGELTLLDNTLSRPNGLAFSPDEKYLYVATRTGTTKYWMRYKVKADGMLGKGKKFIDVTEEPPVAGNPDGMKVDVEGNLYCTGPQGVWIFSPKGELLGKIVPPEIPANIAFGGKDGKTLFMTARKSLYSIRLGIEGVRP